MNYKRCLVSVLKKHLRRALLLMSFTLVITLPLSAQIPGSLPTPPFVPTSPRKLNRSGQGWREAGNTRKWRRQYNWWELIVSVWRLYQAKKAGADWKVIFKQSQDLLKSELDLHADYYNSLSEPDALVSKYYVIKDIQKEFKEIIRLSTSVYDALPVVARHINDEEGELIVKTVKEIKGEAVSAMRYLPMVAGIGNSETAAEAGVQTVDDTFWGSTGDRLQYLDKLHAELFTLRMILSGFEGQVQQIVTNRQYMDSNNRSLESLFGVNND